MEETQRDEGEGSFSLSKEGKEGNGWPPQKMESKSERKAVQAR